MIWMVRWNGDKNKVLLCVLLKCFCRPGENTENFFSGIVFIDFASPRKNTKKWQYERANKKGRNIYFCSM